MRRRSFVASLAYAGLATRRQPPRAEQADMPL